MINSYIFVKKELIMQLILKISNWKCTTIIRYVNALDQLVAAGPFCSADRLACIHDRLWT